MAAPPAVGRLTTGGGAGPRPADPGPGPGPGRERFAAGAVLLLVLSVGWGVNWPIMKVALVSFPPWTFRFASCFVAGLSLLAAAAAAGAPVVPRGREWGALAAASLFSIALFQMIVAYALPRAASGHVALIAFTMPLWVTVIGAAAFGERPRPRTVAALALGLAGLGLLLARDAAGVGAVPLPLLLTVGGAVCWAVGTVIQKRARWSVGTLAGAGWQLLLGSLPMAAAMLAQDEPFAVAAGPAGWLAAAYTTLVALVLCYAVWMRIVSILPAPMAALSTLLVPVVGVVSSGLILGEPLGWIELAAAATILAGLALVLPAGPRR
ncbi:DMT family transporter [Azospirillum sp. ST 5-10]|uniref:DMT family transporter n=1 Tax=unclassified Azospirillum TaxID=2630922 RepID=UPI003F49FF88